MKFLHFVIVGLAGACIVSLSAVANELTLRGALEKAVQGNSELQKYPYQQRMAAAEKIQAGLKPNPAVGIELENIAGSGRNQGVDNLQATLSFSQVIELGGKREQRIEFASVKQKQLNAEFNYAKVDVLAETTSRFYKLVQLQQLANWNQQQQQRLQKALSVARERVKSGAVPPSEETRIELQQRQILAEHEEIKGKIAAAKFRLSTMWAGNPEFSKVIGTFARAPQIPSQADVDDAVNQAPELLRLLDSERLLEARARAFETGSNADLTLGLGVRYNNEFDDTGLVLQASMPLQLENPNAGHIQANQAERDMVLEQQRILRDQLRTHTQMVLARLHTNHQYLHTIESDLLPLARQLEDETEDGYSRGIHSLLQLLDAQEELAQLEYQQINRRYAIYQDILELERMTGQSFFGISAMNFTNVLVLTMTMLFAVSVTSPALASAGDNQSESEQRGPKGGKLLSSENFDLEIIIYESGIPPEMRVYAYKSGELIKPQNLELEVQLHRLGGVTDQLTFTAEDDYLVSNQQVTEPHSYEVVVTASSSGATESWQYESFEGRANLSDRVINKADIRVENATAQTLVFKERLFGVIAPVNDRIAHVRATYRGEVTSVLVDIGERVAAGQTLAVITNATSGTRYEVRSPLDGEVTERFINQGEIAAEQVLFEIVDLSKVWVELSAFPENIEKLQVGQAAEVFDLHQHKRVTGEISYIAPVMTGGHIARARVLVDNEAGHWRPGMHVQADVVTDQKTVELAVNESALQTFRGMPVVFAQYGNTFEVRMVELGQSDGDYVEVLSGLAPNTPYVIGNSYVLKADILKDGASHNH